MTLSDGAIVEIALECRRTSLTELMEAGENGKKSVNSNYYIFL